MDEFTDDRPQRTDTQEGIRDVIRCHEELGGILRNLKEEIDTRLEDCSAERKFETAT